MWVDLFHFIVSAYFFFHSNFLPRASLSIKRNYNKNHNEKNSISFKINKGSYLNSHAKLNRNAEFLDHFYFSAFRSGHWNRSKHKIAPNSISISVKIRLTRVRHFWGMLIFLKFSFFFEQIGKVCLTDAKSFVCCCCCQ